VVFLTCGSLDRLRPGRGDGGHGEPPARSAIIGLFLCLIRGDSYFGGWSVALRRGPDGSGRPDARTTPGHGCLSHNVGSTTAVPQIAAVLLRRPVGSLGPSSEITALPRQKNLKYRFRRELPAGRAEVLPIRVALMPTAGEHLQTLTSIFFRAALTTIAQARCLS